MSNSHVVQAIPAEYSSVTPYVVVKGVAPFIDFLTQVFGAVERRRMPNPDGTIGHAEVLIGASVVMMFDAQPDWPATPSFLNVYIEDCDAVYHKALQAGATSITELATNAWGDRGCRIRDPFGNIWWVLSHVEDVPEDEMMRRMAEPQYQANMQTAVETFNRAMRQI